MYIHNAHAFICSAHITLYTYIVTSLGVVCIYSYSQCNIPVSENFPVNNYDYVYIRNSLLKQTRRTVLHAGFRD